MALLEKRGFLYNHSGDFPQVILIVPSHVPNRAHESTPARQATQAGGIDALESITGLLKSFKIRAL